jgi:hypothetical protein
MRLPDEDLLSVADIATRWKRPEHYVLRKLQRRQFSRVIITKKFSTGALWQAHYYFDKSEWPHPKHETTVDVKRPSWVEMHYLLGQDDENDRWLEGAEAIYIPNSSVKACEQENDIRSEQPSATPSPINPSQLDFSKMSAHLRIAIQADLYLYSQGNITNKQGHRKQITDWLIKEHPTLTANAREAIIAVINRKKGGAPRSD